MAKAKTLDEALQRINALNIPDSEKDILVERANTKFGVQQQAPIQKSTLMDGNVQQSQSQTPIQNIQGQQRSDVTFLGSEGLGEGASAFFPRTAKAVGEGKGFLEQSLGAALDLLSLPGRAGTAALEDQGVIGNALDMLPLPSRKIIKAIDAGEEIDQPFLERLSATEREGTLKDIMSAPETGAALLTAPVTAPIAAKSLLGSTVAGLTEGAISGATGQAERFVEGKELSPSEFALETGISAAIPLGGAGVKKLAFPILAETAQQLSGVSKEALRKFGTGLGRGAKELKQASGTAFEIGDKLLNTIDNFENAMPVDFKSQRDAFLDRMPKISIKEAVGALKKGLVTKNPTSAESTANNRINEYIQKLRGSSRIDPVLGAKPTSSRTISAKEFKNLQDELSRNVDFNTEGFKQVNSALKDARGVMRKNLLETAEKSDIPEYAEQMKNWSKSLKAREEIAKVIGKDSFTRGQRVDSFINTLFGKNKKARRELIKNIEDVTGQEFLKDIQLARLADELGEGGVARIFPAQNTGRALLGGLSGQALGGDVGAVIGTSLSSPRIAAGTLAGTEALGDVLQQDLTRQIGGIALRDLIGEAE